MKNFRLVALIIGASVAMVSCKKKKTEDIVTNTTGNVEIQLEHTWGMSGATFALNTPLKHPMTSDTLTFTTFKYYVSNIKFKKADGTWWVHPESYFLVNLSDAHTTSLSIPNVPNGDYTDMEYTLGVDSTRNVSGAQTGALAASNDMFWSWNSGYIMVKAEGTYKNVSTGNYAFHLGGFSGVNNIVTAKSVAFTGNALTVTGGHTSEVHFIVNPAKLWHSSPSVTTTNTIHMPGAAAKTMANDFYGSFTFDHIHE